MNDEQVEEKLRAAGFYQLWRDPETDLLYRNPEDALTVVQFRENTPYQVEERKDAR
jgi:hypothetical protein